MVYIFCREDAYHKRKEWLETRNKQKTWFRCDYLWKLRVASGLKQCHPRRNDWRRILEIAHHNGRHGQHEAAHDLLGIVGSTCIGERDARADESQPRAPLHLKNRESCATLTGKSAAYSDHQSAHAEDHAEHVHVLRKRVIADCLLLVGSCIKWFVPTRSDGDMGNLFKNLPNNSVRATWISILLHFSINRSCRETKIEVLTSGKRV